MPSDAGDNSPTQQQQQRPRVTLRGTQQRRVSVQGEFADDPSTQQRRLSVQGLRDRRSSVQDDSPSQQRRSSIRKKNASNAVGWRNSSPHISPETSPTGMGGAGVSPACDLPKSTLNLLAKMTYESLEYSQGYRDTMRPLSAFMRHLAKSVDQDAAAIATSPDRARLSIWVPDTIVWEPTTSGGITCDWYYTDQNGDFVKTRKFKLSELQTRFGLRKEPTKTVAVMKYPVRGTRNRCTLLDTTRLAAVMGSLAAPQSAVCLQRFVECRARANLLRCRWKRSVNAIEIHYLISSHISQQNCADEDCLVSAGIPGSIEENSVSQAVGGSLRKELSEFMQRIVTYLATYRKLYFEEFICDFIRDKTDRLWFIQVKAFITYAGTPDGFVWGPGVWAGEAGESGDRGRCGFCECTFKHCNLPCVLNGRQIHGMHERMRHWSSALSWSSSQSTLLAKDATTYQRFQICADCHDLYLALGELTDPCVQLGGLLGANSPQDVLGVDADASVAPHRLTNGDPAAWADTLHAAHNLSPAGVRRGSSVAGNAESSQGPLVRSSSLPQFFRNARERSAVAGRSPPPQMPAEWQFELKRNDTQAVVNVKKPTQLFRFRLLVLIQATSVELRKLKPTIEEHGDLALSWSILGVSRCIALPPDLERDEGSRPLVTALSSQHIYATSDQAIVQWIEASPLLTIYLVAVETGRRLGCFSLDLRHVVISRIELQNHEVPLRGLDTGSLHVVASLGFTGGTAYNWEGLDLQPGVAGLVYVPPPNVVVPEVLPTSWLGILTSSTDVI